MGGEDKIIEGDSSKFWLIWESLLLLLLGETLGDLLFVMNKPENQQINLTIFLDNVMWKNEKFMPVGNFSESVKRNYKHVYLNSFLLLMVSTFLTLKQDKQTLKTSALLIL